MSAMWGAWFIPKIRTFIDPIEVLTTHELRRIALNGSLLGLVLWLIKVEDGGPGIGGVLILPGEASHPQFDRKAPVECPGRGLHPDSVTVLAKR